jgi:hypothetical protein
MKTQSNPSTVKRFIRNVLLVDIGIFGIAGFISLALQFNFGITLLVLGILVGGGGVLLGSNPNPVVPKNPQTLQFRFDKHPIEKTSDQLLYDAKNTLPRYDFENVIVIGGLLAVVLGLILGLL